jgi:hypothetical protein
MKQPEDVHLSHEDGEALIERIERNALSAEDRRVLVKVLTFYFWLLFALREAKLSLKRVKALVGGEKLKKREPPESGGSSSSSGGETSTPSSGSAPVPSVAEAASPKDPPRPSGHGRHGAEVSRAAQTVACRPEELAAGGNDVRRVDVGGYRLPPGIEMRLDGNALLSAVR